MIDLKAFPTDNVRNIVAVDEVGTLERIRIAAELVEHLKHQRVYVGLLRQLLAQQGSGPRPVPSILGPFELARGAIRSSRRAGADQIIVGLIIRLCRQSIEGLQPSS